MPDARIGGAIGAAPVRAAAAPRRRRRAPSRVTFEVSPGKMQLRLSVEGAASQVLDTEMREITVPDLTRRRPMLGTPEVFRARTVRELQQIKADPDAVPVAVREFSRTDRLLIRVPAYGPGDTAPALSVHLLNRAGSGDERAAGDAVGERPASSRSSCRWRAWRQASTSSRSRPAARAASAKELVGFRVTG